MSVLPFSQELMGYHSLAQYEEELQRLAGQPGAIGLECIGFSWEGRPIWALGIGRARHPIIETLVVGLTHGCEWTSGELALALARKLLEIEADQLDEQGRLLSQTAVWIIPVLNPDGFQESGGGDPAWAGDWRKNMRLLEGGPFNPEVDGVDMNRNYALPLEAASFEDPVPPGDNSYPGPYPFSEPETEALRDFCFEHRFSLSFSLHAAGDVLYFPWGYTDDPCPDLETYLQLGEKIAEMSMVELMLENEYGLTPGNSDDYLYSRLGVTAFTLEIGLDPLVAPEDLPALCSEKLPGLLWAIGQVAETIPPWGPPNP